MLPKVKEYMSISDSGKKLLIVAEGFEARSLSFLNSLDDSVMFEDVIICQYEPSKQSRYDEVLQKTEKHSISAPVSVKFKRFEPTVFENELRRKLLMADSYADIYIDISVMSKLLIMIILNELRGYTKNLHIIYSEPVSWRPSKEEYDEAMKERKNGSVICLSSVGVGDIVRTPALSSVVMQKHPVVLIVALSFNEQIVNILVNEINPERVYLINQGCKRDIWREKAIEEIHCGILAEYQNQKDVMEKFYLTEYDKVFEFLVDKYKRFWLTNRIIISPTGYKLHAISFALIKICCPDIHIEYPTPDSYLFDGYSSDEVESIHELQFEGFASIIKKVYDHYQLGG